MISVDYRDRRQDVAQEVEGNEATADLMAWPGSVGLQLSFSAFPVGHSGADHGIAPRMKTWEENAVHAGEGLGL